MASRMFTQRVHADSLVRAVRAPHMLVVAARLLLIRGAIFAPNFRRIFRHRRLVYRVRRRGRIILHEFD